MAQTDTEDQTYFLSYSRTDERFALQFAHDLKDRDVSVWVDQINIRPSEHWDRAIERAVQQCSGLIVILSPRSVASDNVADEISFAIDSGKRVIPILIERCTLPLRITRMHMIDATGDYTRALGQCVTAIKRAYDTAISGAGATRAMAVAMTSPDMVAAAERQLIAILGPIGSILTAKAAARAVSIPELYRLLSDNIDDEADRTRFLAASPAAATVTATDPITPPAAEQAIPADELDRLGALLITYLGPIAPLVVKREGRASGSISELQQRLAALIPDEGHRAAFVKRLDCR